MSRSLVRRFPPALPFAILLLLLFAGIVSAHAELVSADPRPGAILSTPPNHVTLTFDQEVDSNFSDIQVLDKNQARVDNDDLKLTPGNGKQLVITLKPLSDGTYTVVWQALSNVDGHITRGNYAFSVGNASGPAPAPGAAATTNSNEADPLAIAVRWLNLLSLLALVGAFLFRLILMDRSWPLAHMDATAQTRANRAWRQLALVAFYLAFVSEIGSLVVQASMLFNVSPLGLLGTSAVTRTLFETRFGQLWLVRTVLLLALGLLLFMSWRRTRFIGIALGLVILLTVSLGGHSAASGGLVSLPLLADWLHLTAVALWVGGLFSFFSVMSALRGRVDVPTRTRWLAWMIPHFTQIAIPATVIIALTGLYNSLQQVPSLDALIQTIYGEALAIKVALFGIMVALGAVNLLLLTPRFRKAATAPEPAPRLVSRFRMTVGLEVLLGASAIFLAGMLTVEPPARVAVQTANASLANAPSAPQSTLLVDQAAPDVQVQLTLKPAGTNPTDFDIALANPQSPNKPVENVLRVMVQFTLLDRDIGITTQNAEKQQNGHYSLSGTYLTVPGMWRIKVTVRRAGVEDVAVDFPFYEGQLKANNQPSHAEAMQLFQQSEAEMNTFKSMHSQQDLNDGINGVIITRYDYQAPNAMRFQVVGQSESIAIGATQYYQDKAGNWTARARVDPFVFPQFNVSQQAQNVRLGRAEFLNGEQTQIVRYSLPDTSEGSTEYAQWISVQDHRLRQLAMVTASHYMMEYESGYNSPQIAIAAPANVQVPTPESSNTASNPGKILYSQYCAACHGETGHGDGPGGKKLPVQPFDLTTHVLLHDEQYLDAVISNGRGYMPAFKNTLSQDQIFDVIAYIRQLAIQAQRGGGGQPGFTPQAGFTPQP